MEVPVQIAFHKVEPSPWIEEEIRSRIDRLAAKYQRIISTRVTVDRRAANVEGNIPPVVRIEVGLPGRSPVVVAYEPERLQRKFQNPDMRNAINDAFDIADRQLGQIKDEMTGRPEAVAHEAAHEFLGQVAEMSPGEDHGFLLTKEGGLLYFHRNSVLSGDFDSLSRGDEVRYVEDIGDTGPLATKVRVVTRS